MPDEKKKESAVLPFMRAFLRRYVRKPVCEKFCLIFFVFPEG